MSLLSPVFAIDVVVDGLYGDPVFVGQSICTLASGVSGSYGFGNLKTVSPAAPPTFVSHVPEIVSPRTQPQMIDVCTRSVVAGVHDVHAVRYGAVVVGVDESMDILVLPPPTDIDLYLGVPTRCVPVGEHEAVAIGHQPSEYLLDAHRDSLLDTFTQYDRNDAGEYVAV